MLCHVMLYNIKYVITCVMLCFITSETHKGLKRVTGVQCLWIFILTIFGNLSDGYPFSTKWLLSGHHADVLKQEFSIKRQKMGRESSKECSAFFSWRKGSFSSRNRPSRNSTLFSSRRSSWSVLKCNQVSEDFQVHFALYGQDNYVFEREFMYF